MGRKKKILTGKCGVYQILNTVTLERYIGSSEMLNLRLNQHKSDLNKNRHVNRHIQRSYNKYGTECFIFEIVEFCMPNNLIEREQFWIDCYKFRELYNGRHKAENNGGFKWSEEQKKKLVGIARNVKEPVKLQCAFCQKDFFVVPSQSLLAKHCSKDCFKKTIKGKSNSPNTQFKKGQMVWNKNTVGVMKPNKTSFKPTIKFQLVSPNMILYEGVGIQAFAKEMGLCAVNLGMVVRKRYTHHKGWRLPKEGDVYEGIGLWLDAA